jgi:hypothetical protein
MTRFRFDLADETHDAALRRRMAEDWMEGRVVVSFRREPSFFAGRHLQGDRAQTLVCFDRQTDQLVALGTRTSAVAHVNGSPVRIGYLADLRFHPDYRRSTLLARGYRQLRKLHDADPLPFYTSVVYEGNEAALRALRGARAGLPVYREWGRVLTPALRLDRDLPAIEVPGVKLTSGVESDVPAIVEFVNARMATRQFGMRLTHEDFIGGRMNGLRPTDFVVARRDDQLIGTIGLWDQSAVRQTHVERYSGTLGIARPVVSALRVATGGHRLPAPGDRIPSVYLACFAAAEDDDRVAAGLLREALRRARRGGWHFAIVGLHERDPLADVIGRYPAVRAAGLLFVVHYAEDVQQVADLDDRPPHLEAGCL